MKSSYFSFLGQKNTKRWNQFFKRICTKMWFFIWRGSNTRKVGTNIEKYKTWVFKMWFLGSEFFNRVNFSDGNTQKVGTELWSYEPKSRLNCGSQTLWRRSAKQQVFYHLRCYWIFSLVPLKLKYENLGQANLRSSMNHGPWYTFPIPDEVSCT